MPHGWTGGQYSLVRMLLGAYLLTQVIALTRGEPLGYQAVAVVGGGLSVMLLLGWKDRLAAGGLIGVWLILMALQPELPVRGGFEMWIWLPPLLLIGHLLVPSAPFGSVDAWGRPDPAGDWQMSNATHLGAWWVLTGVYLVSGLLMLVSDAWLLGEALFLANAAVPIQPVEWVRELPHMVLRAMTWGLLGIWLAFAPLMLLGITRPLAWMVTLLASVIVLPLAGHSEAAAALALVHLLAFKPAWLAPHWTDAPESLFYDGHCGLCHRWVRFVLSEDRAGRMFELSPLGSDYFHDLVPAARREHLPDSVIVRTPDDRLLVRSSAVLHIFNRLGGLWRVLGWLGRLVPSVVRDWLYDFVASLRRRLFGVPREVCPIVPPPLRERFRL